MMGDVSFLHDTNGLAILNQRWGISLLVLRVNAFHFHFLFSLCFSNFLVSCFVHVARYR